VAGTSQRELTGSGLMGWRAEGARREDHGGAVSQVREKAEAVVSWERNERGSRVVGGGCVR
jgi:hypothetical protein